MFEELAPEHAELRQSARRFAEQMLEPLALEIDRTGTVPPRAMEVLREHGYLGMRLPPEVGGAGLGQFEYGIIQEEFSRSHRIFTLLTGATSGLAPTAILRHGTPAQKDKYLRGLVDGTIRCAFGLTEPESGSDSAAMKTRAVKRHDGWVLNGRKHYINGGASADLVMVMAVTDPEKRARGGITAFLVPRGTPGFTVTRIDTTMGSEAIKLAELTFEDCFVPDEAVLGQVGDGFRFAMESLDEGRMNVACACLGVADRVLGMSITHAQQRHTFGKPLSERQAIQWMLVDSIVELRAARAMTYDVLRRIDAGEGVGAGPSMCKLFCSEMVGRVADRAVQVHGGMGLMRGFVIERFYRDIRHYRVGEGSSEIQRMVIARRLLRTRGG